jgi:hypothetical protein
MCYGAGECKADEEEAVANMLCEKCLKKSDFENKGFDKPFDEYNFCKNCIEKIDKFFEERYKDF